MTESATGIVLRLHRHSESSLIVRWLTVDSGRVSTLARGARRPKSPFTGKLDLFVEADLTFHRSRNTDLHTLREVEVRDYHLPLRAEVERLQVAAYGSALLEQTTESDTPLPGLFELFAGLLQQLSVSGPRPRLIFAFELKLLDALGLSPSLETAGLKPAARELIVALTRGSWAAVQDLKPAAGTVRELGAFLHRFLMHHVGRIPKTRGGAFGISSR